MALDCADDVFPGNGADDGVYELAILENDERRDTANVEPARRHVGVLVDVHLADGRAAGVLRGQLFDDGRDASAGSAPFGPEIDQDDTVLGLLVEVAVGKGFDV